MERNQGFENSLRCLQHPLSLISIALLLLNDHVFKIICPSWMTGKLSDFAGLFFFPFIVTAILSLVLTKFNFTLQQIGQISFGSVAVWFVLLKTSHPINHLSTQFSSLLLGSSTYYTLDWTDIFGLIMLLPAWNIWQKPTQTSLAKWSYIHLAAGLFACLATSPALPPFDTVSALAYKDGLLYARGTESYYFVQSTDNGDNWEWIFPQDQEREDVEALFPGNSTPMQVCNPRAQQDCYRIDGGGKVFVSNDGGTNWDIGWEVPSERSDFVFRIAGEITTHDLLLIDENNLSFLFVAMGNNGVLRKQLPDGQWERIGVEEAQPTPFSAPNLITAILIVQKELLIWIGIAYLGFLITNIAIWNRFSDKKSLIALTDWLSYTIIFTFVFILVEAVIVFAGFLLLVVLDFLTHFLSGFFIDTISKLAVFVAIIAPFSWSIRRTNKWIIKNSQNETARPKIILYCSLTVIGIILIGGSPWLLWTWGIIPKYQTAQIVSITISILITATGYYSILKSK